MSRIFDILCGLLAVIPVLFMSWTTGFNFDSRGLEAASTACISLGIFLLVYFYRRSSRSNRGKQ